MYNIHVMCVLCLVSRRCIRVCVCGIITVNLEFEIWNLDPQAQYEKNTKETNVFELNVV